MLMNNKSDHFLRFDFIIFLMSFSDLLISE